MTLQKDMLNPFIALTIISFIFLQSPAYAKVSPEVVFVEQKVISRLPLGNPLAKQKKILSEKEISLSNRQLDKSVNEVFKDNILLNLSYMDKKIFNKSQINWAEITKPQSYSFTLNPGETFAFHDDILDKYQGKVVKTTNANFNYQDGFKSDGYLTGDGICHLASLMNWAARDANLDVEAPTNHNFAVIPDISREFGTAIFKTPGNRYGNSLENLYITNNQKRAINFNFEYKNDNLKLTIIEVN